MSCAKVFGVTEAQPNRSRITVFRLISNVFMVMYAVFVLSAQITLRHATLPYHRRNSRVKVIFPSLSPVSRGNVCQRPLHSNRSAATDKSLPSREKNIHVYWGPVK